MQDTSPQVPPAVTRKFVLIVEDDKFYANIYKTKLGKQAYDVVVAGNGKQGLDEVQKRRPDLILLDLVMPIMDGFTMLSNLRSNSELKPIPIVVLSNLSQQEDIKKAKDLGVIDYLVKTNLSISEMMAKIKQYLQ